MDKIAHYQKLIKTFLQNYAALSQTTESEIVLAFDDIHQQYLLRELGWTPDNRIHYTRLHVALKNGKIWVEEDMTEDGIATYFLEQGVPPTDIVLAFHPPELRPYTEFATA